jgi:hypothetical protein
MLTRIFNIVNKNIFISALVDVSYSAPMHFLSEYIDRNFQYGSIAYLAYKLPFLEFISRDHEGIFTIIVFQLLIFGLIILCLLVLKELPAWATFIFIVLHFLIWMPLFDYSTIFL